MVGWRFLDKVFKRSTLAITFSKKQVVIYVIAVVIITLRRFLQPLPFVGITVFPTPQCLY